MRNKLLYYLGLVLLVGFSGGSIAVEIQPGQRYAAGTFVEGAAYGVGFTIPEKWSGVWPQGAEMMVLSNEKAYIFVYVDRMEKNKALELMSQNVPLDSGVVLTPKKQPVFKSLIIANDYNVTGVNKPLASHIKAKVGDNGTVIFFLVVSEKSFYKNTVKIALDLIDGTKFSKIKSGGCGKLASLYERTPYCSVLYGQWL